MVILARLTLVFFLAVSGLAISGCSRGDRPELGSVRGTVTVGEEGVSGVIVQFEPEEGRASVAQTDSKGNYELVYVHGVKGAKLGSNTVRLIWPDGESASVPIPEKFGAESEVKVDVEPGRNRFDFDLAAE